MSADAVAMFAEGARALEAQDLGAAEQCFRSIVAQNPRAHAAWNALSVVTLRGGVPDIALEHARRALELDRRNPVYLNSLGVAYGELGQFLQAEEAFRRALKVQPVYPEGLFNLGKVLHKQGKSMEAVAAFERAHAMKPDFPGLKPYLAVMYRKLGRTSAAMEVLKPGGSEVNVGLVPAYAACIAEQEGPESAIQWMRERLERNADLHELRSGIAGMLLSTGKWLEGWHEYLYRQRPDNRGAPSGVLPEDLRQRRIELKADQGIGDTLFFLRFAGELRRRGAVIALECPMKLRPLLTAGGVVDEIIDRAGPGALWCGDLPAMLRASTVPPAVPVAAERGAMERQRAALSRLGPGPHLALTWRAGTDILRQQEFGGNRMALMKEVPIGALGEAVRGWRGTLVSVQRLSTPAETEAMSRAAQAPVHDLSALNEDLAEMLGFLAVVDEYVCVSNTNVHLAASLGRPCRVLVGYPPDWRWMSTDGDSQWFPGFPTYREPQSRGWAEPLARLRADLGL